MVNKYIVGQIYLFKFKEWNEIFQVTKINRDQIEFKPLKNFTRDKDLSPPIFSIRSYMWEYSKPIIGANMNIINILYEN